MIISRRNYLTLKEGGRFFMEIKRYIVTWICLKKEWKTSFRTIKLLIIRRFKSIIILDVILLKLQKLFFRMFDIENLWKNLILTPLIPLETDFYPLLSNSKKPTDITLTGNTKIYYPKTTIEEFIEEFRGYRLAHVIFFYWNKIIVNLFNF